MKGLLYKSLLFICALLVTSCKHNEPQIIALQDNVKPRMMATALFADTTPDGVIEELGLQDGIPSSVCSFLVITNGKKILFDSGNGAEDSQLLPQLAANNIEAEDIDYIMITHMHGDHIGGLLSGDNAVFTNATLFIPSKEHDSWMTMGENQSAQLRKILKAYDSKVKIFSQQDKLPCDIEPIAAYGHTPGHTIYRIGNNIIAGDIMHGIALQLKYPEVCARFDMDKTQAIASRKELIRQARDEGLKVYGMHFPDPYYIELE